VNPEATDCRYLFDRFVLDPLERRLENAGREVHLRPRTLDTLIYLVEHQGHLVTKQALLDTLRAGTEVTENALIQCIRELREVLGDDERHPRFIQTVSRAGYRFVADVERAYPSEDTEYEEEGTAASVLVAGGEDAPAPATATATGLIPRHRRRAVLAAAAIALVAGAVGVGTWLARRTPAMAFSERDWVLIADFENLTGEPAFDAAVRSQLERELSVSRFVNVVPRGRVADTLRLVKQPADTRVTEAVGRAICLRDGGIRAMLAGTIESTGGAYALTLRLIDPSTGATVTAFDGRALARQEVLDAVHRMSGDVRRRLGEPPSAVAQPGPPLERVTTPSLEALTPYSRGVEQLDQFEWSRAETSFDQAVAADSSFALGYFFRGVSRMMVGRNAAEDLKRAAELAGHITPRERLMVQTAVSAAPGNHVKAIDLYESLIAQYPDDYWAHEFVSWHYLVLDNYPRFKEHQAACRRLRPNFAQPRFHAGWTTLLIEGDGGKAQADFARVLELDPDFSSTTVQCSRAFVYWMQGGMDRAASEFAEFRQSRMAYLSAAAQVSARPYLARFYAFQSQPAEALAMLETNRDMTFPLPDADLARRFTFERGLIYQQLGRADEFVRLMRESAAASVGMGRVEALGWLGIDMARRGRTAEARSLQQDLAKETREPRADFWNPRQPLQLERARQAFGLQIEGEILLSDNRTDAAVERFEEVLALVPPRNALFNTTLAPRVWLAAAQSLARAHERRGDWSAAARAYVAILEHKALCIGTDGAALIWLDALNSVSGALEKAGRSAEAARYREEHRRLQLR
jgi:DNA-binding winged helix-turn-helix (wHTH) protein/tetratricopeptide (TPR) repeat protein